jgi:ribosome biogenesis protein MAK21
LLNSHRLNKHLDTLFLITHTSTFNISLQALVLIQHICASLSKVNIASPSAANTSLSKTLTDRYYRALYASLHDSRLAQSSKQAMYLNLFFRSIKTDVDTERVRALIRRFVQVLAIGGSGATEFVAGGLFLLGEVSRCTHLLLNWNKFLKTNTRFCVLFLNSFLVLFPD